MNLRSITLCALLSVLLSFAASAQTTTIKIFDKILFYDGYAKLVSKPLPPGIIRHRNDLIARKLTEQELQSIGTNLSMKVVVKASCDNYDRIGNVNLAFVPKGDTTYIPDSVDRIELGRYITPFMNKNRQPDTVPYNYSINNVASLLKENSIAKSFDIWVELELFGVPYAAQQQVSGCSGRNDVFFGSLDFIIDGSTQQQNNNYLLPLQFKKDLNNYKTSATDTIGKTTRTISFNVPENLTDAVLYLITSNHGANTDGEEYNRRAHYVYMDGKQVLQYVPGSPSCEPFRKYNTQANGIYGYTPRTDAEWQSFSNWCPGAVIPIRTINLGNLSAAEHKFMITVPDAVFNEQQGYIPVSVYLQAKTSGSQGINENKQGANKIYLYPNPVTDFLTVETESKIRNVTFYNVIGQRVLESVNPKINVSQLSPGVYFIHLQLANNQFLTRKMIKN